jgi:hypothetical protein
MRTDSHNNPTAFTTDIARQAGLREGIDFSIGDSFRAGVNSPLEYTARLIGDPIALTIRVIDAVGFYAHAGGQRWSYIALPPQVWGNMSPAFKAATIGGMYNREGGTEMKKLFPTPFLF